MINSFDDIFGVDYYNKEIVIECVISGKGLVPYCVPIKFNIKCFKNSKKDNDTCESCVVAKNQGYLTIDIKNENILKLIDIPITKLPSVLVDVFGLNTKGGCKFTVDTLEMINIERIFIFPITGKEKTKSLRAHIAYFIGYGLDINKSYKMYGYSTVDPIDSTVTQVFVKAKKLKSDIDGFKLTTDKWKQLNEFCVEGNKSEYIFNFLEKLYKYYSHNITNIYSRFDLHLAVDLPFKSALSFDLGNETIDKGWLDIMIIGDTRCGKGFVAEKLARYFGLGEVISADNASFAGLVGGLQQIGRQWAISWGKLPLNNEGLVIIDEASEIQHSDWTRLSRIRSEGIAEIIKINVHMTAAKTRLIFIGNPINKSIRDYSYGIQCLTEVVKSPEDIARFDYVLVVSHSEVLIDTINEPKTPLKKLFNSDIEHELILWVWGRKKEEIVFSKKAVKLVYVLAVKISKQYSFTIPLIQGENIRIKLAKIAVCFAARVFSNKMGGKILYVKAVHVECAYVFLNLIYKKPASGYYLMSKLEETSKIKPENFEKIEKYFNAYRNKYEICKCLLINNNITVTDISEHLNQPKEIAREIVSVLLKYNCVIKKFTYYIKTPEFTDWLKKLLLFKKIKRG